MASGAVSRKATSSYSSTSARNLDNNLDALLDDLQTSISSSGSTSRIATSTPQHNATRERIIETTASRGKSPLRSSSPLRTMSPGQTRTIEKYVSTGPAGSPSGIPGLEMLDKELQDVQPGQSKTVAYKQVSYHYDKSQEGKDLEPWLKTDKISSSRNDTSIVDDFCERTFEKSSSSSRAIRDIRDSPDFAKSNKEIIYKADVSTKMIPTPLPTVESRSSERDFKYIKETSYHTEPSPISPRRNIKTVRTDETEELTNVEYIPAEVPLPGPNTKVTTTVKTYSYELPGGGPTRVYHPPSSNTSTLTKDIKVDKAISYTVPRDAEKTVTYHIEEQRGGVREYVPAPSPTTSRVHREVYVERRGYRPASPPPPVISTTVTRNEKYLQQSSSNGYGPVSPPPQTVVDHTGSRTSVKHYEEHYSSSRPPAKPQPYYPSSESSHHSSTHHVYKYDEQQSLLPKPFPTSERPASPRQQPPRRIEDLMASFSDSEEVVEVMEKRERKSTRENNVKKEVDFVPHTPPVAKSKNVAGPPVYYPPGSGEFTRKEESMAAMSKASGGWAKERAAYEYGASSRSEEKVKTKKAVVPVCLPLCCALPCVIM